MKVFVTGANGFVGSAMTAELLRVGHEVIGLAHSSDSARALQAAGVAVERGSLENHESLRAGVSKADAVIHLAFGSDFSQFQENSRIDQRAIETIGAEIAGSAKPFLVTNGLAGIAPSGELATEDRGIPKDYPFPRASEQTALRLASEGSLVGVVRLAQVHDKKKQGLVSALTGIAQRQGISAYVAEGRNRWPAVHVSDVGHLFRLALETPSVGAVYHAVGEEGVEMHLIAEAIGRKLGIPTMPLGQAKAQEHFGPLGMFVAQDMPASASATIQRLGWQPKGTGLLADIF